MRNEPVSKVPSKKRKVTDKENVPSKFKVGDQVICNVNGLGKITENVFFSQSGNYPILVEFKHSNGDIYYETYTPEGKMYSDKFEDEGEHIRHLTKLEKALR